jgi:hypothetical protein
MGKACITHIRGEMHIKFQSENSKGRDHLQDLGVDGRIIIKWCGLDSTG